MALDEKLAELTEQLAQANAEIERLKEENDTLQVEAANKIANAKVDFETKEIEYKKQIKDLRQSLELRNDTERRKLKSKDKKSVNQLWEEITGEVGK